MSMKRDIPTFLLYVFSFFLLWEWLRPVNQLTDTGNMGIFIIFLIISFTASFLNLKVIWQSILMLILILFSIHHLHYEEGMLNISWFSSFIMDCTDNIRSLVGGQWYDLTNEFRTLLFFILLGLMVYLIHYWILRKQRIFIFFFLTLVYVTVLDTFTAYNAKTAIIRTVVSGFAVMGMLTYYRIIQKERVHYDTALIRRWMIPLAVMIAVSILVGIAAPKAAPIWPDPVPYLTAKNDKADPSSEEAGPHRIGYSTDDTALGGPFVGDDQAVFTYEGNGETYWKMETKDMYTGKGWIASGSTFLPFKKGDLVPIYSIPDEVETITETARVNLDGSYKFNNVMYPAGVTRVLTIQPSKQDTNEFLVDGNNEKISFVTSSQQPVVPQLFTVEFDVPKYKASELVKTTSFPAEMNRAFYEKYTMLPVNLPPRVKELTEEITKGKTNWYDKAKAVEAYFGNTGYSYDQKNAAVPGEKDDYVDQFLFDTKRGYCDNFSTSMAVMLRTIGIPTRWVKGYTGGESHSSSKEGSAKQFYEVTNNNAHSWVEVFFPNLGWVPFEPTVGFSNEVTIHNDVKDDSTISNQPVTSPSVNKTQEEKKEPAEPKKDLSQSNGVKTMLSTVKLYWVRLLFITLLLAGIAGLLYRLRGRLAPYGILFFYKFMKKDENIGSAYLILLGQLDRYGLKRKENQTLRSYACYIDTFYSTREMTRLTARYEQYLYHQTLPKGTWEETRELWENLIKKTIA
ncbi:transglutaminaseTgpA domain-containing protein [Neobacillus drentensis]|uniref:transglutaminase TgpA family protein n=1 Tax=Neobacillus drentensis TaxID=220684 RepID=UPI0030007AEE